MQSRSTVIKVKEEFKNSKLIADKVQNSKKQNDWDQEDDFDKEKQVDQEGGQKASPEHWHSHAESLKSQSRSSDVSMTRCSKASQNARKKAVSEFAQHNSEPEPNNDQWGMDDNQAKNSISSSRQSADGWGNNRVTEWNPEEQKESRSGSQSQKICDDKTLYVGWLCKKVTQNQLKQRFEEIGPVDKVEILIDKDTGDSKGFGFVTYSTAAHAKEAMNALNGIEFERKFIKVQPANRSRPRPKTPGKYLGKDSRSRQRSRSWSRDRRDFNRDRYMSRERRYHDDRDRFRPRPRLSRSPPSQYPRKSYHKTHRNQDRDFHNGDRGYNNRYERQCQRGGRYRSRSRDGRRFDSHDGDNYKNSNNKHSSRKFKNENHDQD